MVQERLQAKDCITGFNLDGFPRAVAQAEALEKILTKMNKKLDHVISIEVPEEELVRRLTGRRSCPKCGAMFHVMFTPPKKEGVCDGCGSNLIQRSDDNEATIRNRIDVYREQTEPLEKFYEKKQLLRSVAGMGTPQDIEKRIFKIVGVK
jgi:adenylate kinase